MAFEITVPEALAILGVTRRELSDLVRKGHLREFVGRVGKSKKERRFLLHEEVMRMARVLEERRATAPPARRPSPREPAPELVNVVWAARLLDVSLPTLYALIDEGQLPVARTSRQGHLHFRREDVVALIESRRALRCRLPSKGRRAPADDLVDVPSAALLLHTTPVRVYGLVREGFLQVAHVSADGARCFRRDEVLAHTGSGATKS